MSGRDAPAGDGKFITDAVITADDPGTLRSESARFTPDDSGKLIMVKDAGPDGKPLICTILYASPHVVKLSLPAARAVSGTTALYATDDTADFQRVFGGRP